MGTKRLDKIRLQAIRVPCLIGVHEHERTARQDIVADITLFVDLRKACSTDNLADTVDYQALETNVVQCIKESATFLVEKLADNLVRCCLTEPAVKKVRIRIN